MVKILVKKFDKSIKLPIYKTTGSSGMDLTAYIEKGMTIYPGKTSLVPTGIALAIPKNYISVLNTPGTIDSDYRGEIKVILINFGKKAFKIKSGDRIAQMVICPISKGKFVEVDNLPHTIRGKGGFGSTGKK